MESSAKSNDHQSKEDPATELAKQRTTLSFQRTRLAADRTLMSVIRTSLSLIGFGFTIFQFFRSLNKIVEIDFKKSPGEVADDLGLSMVAIGIGMLLMGISYHIVFMLQIRKERKKMEMEHNIVSGDTFPISMTLLTALALMLLGVYIIFRMIIAINS